VLVIDQNNDQAVIAEPRSANNRRTIPRGPDRAPNESKRAGATMAKHATDFRVRLKTERVDECVWLTVTRLVQLGSGTVGMMRANGQFGSESDGLI